MNFEFERVFFEAKYSHFFWIYGVFIYFCFEMKMFYFISK